MAHHKVLYKSTMISRKKGFRNIAKRSNQKPQDFMGIPNFALFFLLLGGSSHLVSGFLSMANKSPSRIVPLINGLFLAYEWWLLTTYKSWDDPPSSPLPPPPPYLPGCGVGGGSLHPTNPCTSDWYIQG